MEGRQTESKGSVREMETLFYGMSGVGKSTISTDCSIKRDFIRGAVNGRGVWIN